MKINKVLIANRGEIALRVIKTCKRMGIKTVTLYTEEDKHLPHSYMSDEAYPLGQGTLAETYLNQDLIIKIAKESGADAIHPGYGFLSENTEFCKRISEENLIFIGPSVSAIELMGDKKTSKVKMEEIGIPLIPGYHGDNQDAEFLKTESKKIGFPVLIKATAGGGGKGMRIVRTEAEFIEALEGAKREALNAFSNDKVLIEKYIENPRHIEVQLVSDGQNNHYHFYDRECSIQRRYQKVIEETPSVAFGSELREEICKTAVKISTGIDYVGAGTIEFILAPDNNFYFLEMNTRLQVEHPVTEMVTGFDLVELQIRAASGEAFNFKQSDIKQTGHSIEVRIYAEDPDNNFLPTIGKIQKIGHSKEEGVRLDCGFADGTYISVNYDPMIAKLIVFADNRELAISKMNTAINEILFNGVKTNRDYLKRILNHPKFKSGEIHTHFIEVYADELKPQEIPFEEKAGLIAASLFLNKNNTVAGTNSWNSIFNFRNI